MNEYSIVRNSGRKENRYEYGIEINPDSAIFKGHFPEGPVSPGLCGISIVTKCFSDILGQRLEFVSIDRCRFFSAIRPAERKPLIVDMALSDMGGGMYYVTAEVADDSRVLIELSGCLAATDYLQYDTILS